MSRNNVKSPQHFSLWNNLYGTCTRYFCFFLPRAAGAQKCCLLAHVCMSEKTYGTVSDWHLFFSSRSKIYYFVSRIYLSCRCSASTYVDVQSNSRLSTMPFRNALKCMEAVRDFNMRGEEYKHEKGPKPTNTKRKRLSTSLPKCGFSSRFA